MTNRPSTRSDTYKQINTYFVLEQEDACLLEVRAVRIDHDAVGVSVNHLQPQLRLCEIHGALQTLSSLSGHKSCDRFRVETADRRRGKSRTEIYEKSVNAATSWGVKK